MVVLPMLHPHFLMAYVTQRGYFDRVSVYLCITPFCVGHGWFVNGLVSGEQGAVLLIGPFLNDTGVQVLACASSWFLASTLVSLGHVEAMGRLQAYYEHI